MAGKYTLGKTERLKSRKKIEALFSGGQRITSVPFLVYYRVHDDVAGSQIQAGFSASKKNFRKAADRNRAKRILREVYRLQNTALKTKVKTGAKSLDIFIIFTGKELPVYKEVSEKFEPVLQKLMAIYDKA
ncbi:MAG: ribonuclease P protein component [Chitinophagaceae bacterium]